MNGDDFVGVFVLIFAAITITAFVAGAVIASLIWWLI